MRGCPCLDGMSCNGQARHLAEVVVDGQLGQPDLVDGQRPAKGLDQGKSQQALGEAGALDAGADSSLARRCRRSLAGGAIGGWHVLITRSSQPRLDLVAVGPLVDLPLPAMVRHHHPHRRSQERDRRHGEHHVEALQVVEGVVGGSHGKTSSGRRSLSVGAARVREFKN